MFKSNRNLKEKKFKMGQYILNKMMYLAKSNNFMLKEEIPFLNFII